MTDAQRELAGGIAALVRYAPAGDVVYATESDEWHPEKVDHVLTVYGRDSDDPPPLSPLQTLALSVLVAPSAEVGSMLIDALRECGVIDENWEEVVRKDERDKAADVIEDRCAIMEGSCLWVDPVELCRLIRTPAPAATVDSRGTV
jgi:hypothetical protein